MSIKKEMIRDWELKDIDWTQEQKNMISSLINRFGSGLHPVCEDNTFDYFKTTYLIEILNSNKFRDKEENLSVLGRDLVNSIKNKLDI